MIVTQWANAQNAFEQKCARLLMEERFFELRDYTNGKESNIPEVLRLRIESQLGNSFNRNAASNAAIQTLLDKYQKQLHDTIIRDLLSIQADNYAKLFDYEQAYLSYREIISHYQHTLDSSDHADYVNMRALYQSLASVPKQEVIHLQDSRIQLKRDKVGLMNVPTQIIGETYDLIFDTGAGFCTIREGFALELGLDIIDQEIKVYGANGSSEMSRITVMEELRIGNAVYRNVIFFVLRDELLEFPSLDYSVSGIIGFPVIEEFGTFTITHQDSLFIEQRRAEKPYGNLSLDGQTPQIYMFNGSDSLLFAFDTGARTSFLTKNYYDLYPKTFDGYQLDSVKVTGLGGDVSLSGCNLKEVSLWVGAHRAELENIRVLAEKNRTFVREYGNIGQDLIKQFDRMTISFEHMYVGFE
jgi:predicted aspartyl protease